MKKNCFRKAGGLKIVVPKSQNAGFMNKHLENKNSEYNLISGDHKPSDLI